MQELDCYLVGGAVRDELLGREVGDYDWVVVGATPEQMEALQFVRVGRDFPVYLHPETHDEYALARTERKQGSGHKGFVVDADPTVTLVEDLSRRDLTINAIAKSVAGELVDPYGGVADLRAGILRHVSEAFIEDPLRVFRVARLSAQLPDFVVADETAELMRRVNAAGELQTLSAERVWQELAKALGAPAPFRFFEVLGQCGGLADWFEEIVPTALVFNTTEVSMRYAELPLTEVEFKRLGQRLKVPGPIQQGATDRLRWASVLTDWEGLPAKQLHDAFIELKVNHSTSRLVWLLEYLQINESFASDGLLKAAAAWAAVRLGEEVAPGPAYGEALTRARVEVLEAYRSR